MKSKGMVWIVVCAAMLIVGLSDPLRSSVPEKRSFEFTYVAELDDIPADAGRVDLWLPYPTSDSWQKVEKVDVDSPYPTTISRDAKYGNKILHVVIPKIHPEEVKVAMTVQVTRQE